jgi:hypothetical protein
VSWAASVAGAAVARDVLAFLGLEVAKADPDPLSREGFDEIVMALVTAMRRSTGEHTDAIVRAATQRLDRDWGRLTEPQREEAFQRAAGAVLERIDAMAAAATAPIEGSARNLIRNARRATSAANGLSVRDIFSASDEVAARFARTSSGFFFRSTGGRILSGAVDTAARRVIAKGLREGWDKQTTGENMATALRGTVGQRSQAYFEMVASVAMARARTYSTLRAFDDAGITVFKLQSVLDEVTSDICRFMHGRSFEVRSALRRYEEVNASPPGAVVDLQPFVRLGRRPDGSRALFVESGGTREELVDVVRSAVGQKDRVGSFRPLVPDARIASLGCSCPPFHPHCRTVMLAVSSRVISTPVGRPAFAPPAPATAPVPAAAPPAPRPPRKPRAPAPPPLGAFQLGVHIKNLVSKVSRAILRDFMKEVSSLTWALDILRVVPLDELQVAAGSRGNNGVYSWGGGRRTIMINGGRKPGTWGNGLLPGSSWSVSNVGSSKRNAMTRTFVHELAHHVHHFDWNGVTPATQAALQVNAVILAAFARTKGPLTMYGLNNAKEYFAESFAAYVFERAALQLHDPVGMKMVEDVLAIRGFTVP